MSDLGGDAGQSALSLGAKVIEALLRLLDKLYQAYLDKGRRELTQEQLASIKDDKERKQALENLNGKAGLVNYEELKKSGVPLSSFNLYATEQEMQQIGELCKRGGILISGMTDDTKMKNGEVAYCLCCKTEDLQAFKDIVNRAENEVRIENGYKRETEILSKGEENLTDADRVELNKIRAEREEIQRSSCRDMNDKTTDSVVENVVTGGKENPITIDKALDHYCGGGLDKKNEFSIVADAQDPSKFIRCHGEDAEFNGKAYTKTTYEVCHDDKVLMTTHDGKFEGRPKDYWQQQKDAMQEAGQFSGTFYKFYSEDEYREWAKGAEKQNEAELDFMEIPDDKERADVAIQKLGEQLDERGMQMLDGKVCDKQAHEEVQITSEMTAEQKIDATEALKIGEQINNYQEMQNLYNGVLLHKATLEIADPESSEYKEAKTAVEEFDSKIAVLKEKEQELASDRKEINGAEVEQDVRESTEERLYAPEDRSKIAELNSEVRKGETELDNLYEEHLTAAEEGNLGKAAQLSSQIDKKAEEVADLKDEESAVRTVSAVKQQQMEAVEIKYLPEDKAKIDALEAEIANYDKHPRAVANLARRSDGSTVAVQEIVPVEKVKAELAKLKEEAVANAQKQDERREDRVAEKDEKQVSMEESKGQIAKVRAEQAQANDVKDRAVMNQGAKAATEKSSKPLER